ncbi:unnamed protein product [Owenia fusiformis]|uniref:Uncharacterized protein n=1 Tax=Owenia fusiformis TaxID=6347 RepID=A0A8J1V2E1_OWEFU|nr:unnamed protein product [Owenia fusiformis]
MSWAQAMAVDHCKNDVVKQLYQKEAQFRLGLVLTCKASAYGVKLQKGADMMVTPKPEFVCFVYDHWTKILEARVADVKSPPLKELGDFWLSFDDTDEDLDDEENPFAKTVSYIFLLLLL